MKEMHNKAVLQTVFRWFAGAGISVVLVWGITAFWLDSITVYEWNSTLGTFVIAPTQKYVWHSEGWAETQIGKYGINAIDDVTAVSGLKVAIWGDSFVAAFQVPDEDKMAQQVTRIWNESHDNELTAIGIGAMGQSPVDYYFGMPKYKELLGSVVAHFVILTNVSEVLPIPNAKECRFVSEPEYRFIESKWHPRHLKERPAVQAYHMEFLWTLGRELFLEPWRFRVGPVERDNPEDELPYVSTEPMAFLLDKFKKIEKEPIVFIYMPSVPSIENGAIQYDDPDAVHMELFAGECEKRGFSYINLGEKFEDLHRRTGRFPRGFWNWHPFLGHLNAHGHRIVAEAICEYIETYSDALFK